MMNLRDIFYILIILESMIPNLSQPIIYYFFPIEEAIYVIQMMLVMNV